MRLYRPEDAEEKPVSHNPELKKRVLVPDGVGPVRHISRISLAPGSTALAHSHEFGTEVFFCLAGEIAFSVGGQSVSLTPGSCLVVEPGEEHAIVDVKSPSDMLYMMVAPD